jgi:hypothetical protein
MKPGTYQFAWLYSQKFALARPSTPAYFEIFINKSLKWRNNIFSNIGRNDIKHLSLKNLLFRYKNISNLI